MTLVPFRLTFFQNRCPHLMTRTRYPLAPSIILMAMAACTHTDPPTSTSNYGATGPLDGTVPIRLTWSPLVDRGMSWSPDSRLISYSYQSGRPDRDVCLGVLPANGGQRTVERCGWGVDDARWTDGLNVSTISPGGNLVFVRHLSAPMEQGFRTAELFIQPLKRSGEQPVKIADLGRIPTGAQGRWDTFIDPVWLDDGSMLVLGAHSIRRNSCVDGCPFDRPRYNGPDTIALGVELARLSGLDAGRMDVSSVVAAPGLLSLALDRQKGSVLLLRQYHDQDDDVFYESLADTLFTLPTGGGALVPMLGTPRDDGPYLERFHSVAVAGDRIFLSRSFYSSSSRGPRPEDLGSDIAELLPDGSLVNRWTAAGGRWGRISAAPDGSALLAELLGVTISDIYLIPLR